VFRSFAASFLLDNGPIDLGVSICGSPALLGMVADLLGVDCALSSVVEDPYSCFWKELLPVTWWFVTLTLGMVSAMLTCHEGTWVFPVTMLDGSRSRLCFFVMRITRLDFLYRERAWTSAQAVSQWKERV